MKTYSCKHKLDLYNELVFFHSFYFLFNPLIYIFFKIKIYNLFLQNYYSLSKKNLHIEFILDFAKIII